MYKVTIRTVETMCDAMNDNYKSVHDVSQYVAKCMLQQVLGGVTIDAPSLGMWKDENGKCVTEYGQDVWTMVETKDEVVKLRGLAHFMKTMGNQDCVMFTVLKYEDVSFI